MEETVTIRGANYRAMGGAIVTRHPVSFTDLASPVICHRSYASVVRADFLFLCSSSSFRPISWRSPSKRFSRTQRRNPIRTAIDTSENRRFEVSVTFLFPFYSAETHLLRAFDVPGGVTITL